MIARSTRILSILTLGVLVITPSAFGQGQASGGSGRGRGRARAEEPPAKPFTRLPAGKPDMQGYWQTANFFTAFDLETREKEQYGIPAGKGVVVDPPDGKIPYQPWALEKKKDLMEHHLFEDPQAHCYLSGVPRQMYTPFGFQMLQPAGSVVLLYEAFHSYRIIPVADRPLDNRPHIPDAIRLFEGDSRGHWDGDTLVVDVTNQNPGTWFDMAANFHSDALHVVERFTMKDSNTIRYDATLDDVKVFTRPWTIAFNLVRNHAGDYEQMEYASVEGEKDLQHHTETEGAKPKK
jgi:hypothetical protein